MYLFASILFLGFISFSAAGPINDDTCPNTLVKHNFKPQLFFSGNWTLSRILFKQPPVSSYCVKIEGEILHNNNARGTTVVLMKTMETDFFEGFVNLDERTDGIAKYNAEIRSTNKDGKPLSEFSDLFFIIMATDYENYSIIVTCSTPTLPVTYAILKRNETEELNPEAEAILSGVGLPLSQFDEAQYCYII